MGGDRSVIVSARRDHTAAFLFVAVALVLATGVFFYGRDLVDQGQTLYAQAHAWWIAPPVRQVADVATVAVEREAVQSEMLGPLSLDEISVLSFDVLLPMVLVVLALACARWFLSAMRP